jgi:hypothetical protein
MADEETTETQADSFANEEAEISEKDIVDLFTHDPFDSNPKDDEPEVEAAVAHEAKVEERAAEPVPKEAAPQLGAQQEPTQPEEGAPTEAQPAQQAQTSEVAELLATVREQQQTIQGLMQQQAQAAQAQAQTKDAATPEEPKIETPAYEYTIPDQIVDGLRSEDPQHTRLAIMALVKGAGQSIHQEVVKAMRAEIQQSIPDMVQTQVQTQDSSQQIFNDFYGTYPQLNNPAFHGMVHAVAAEVMQRPGHNQWNAQTRDAIYGEVVGQINAAMGQTAPAGTPVPPTSAPQVTPQGSGPPAGQSAAQPWVAGTNARPQVRSTNAISDQVSDLLKM